MRAANVLETIGNTPHIRINRLFPSGYEVWSKSERANPGGSIKDRIALSMVEAAERDGRLAPGGTIIEPTSGNTGIGLAMVAAVKGYPLLLVMPDSMSVERRRLMLAYGAKFVLTPREKGMKGAIERAEQLAGETPGSWIPQQFDNPANIDVHVKTTAQEILLDFPEGLDAIVTGVGTGGHISAIGLVLKPKWPRLKVFAVEPAASPVISAGNRHRIRSRVSAPDSFRTTSRPRCWTASSPWRPKRRARWRAGPHARKACWSGSRRVRRWPPSRKSCRNLAREAKFSASTTTPASATCRPRDSFRSNSSRDAAAYLSGAAQ